MLLAAIGCSMTLRAEVNDSTIVDRLNSAGTIKIDQPASLGSRLGKGSDNVIVATVVADSIGSNKLEAEIAEKQDNAPQAAATKKVAGYRVQVFSDNNPRTAKAEARAKAKELANALPYKTYVVFTAPYWRLRVGDFTSKEEAEVAATRIKKKFPGYSAEIRIVRDKINH